jgi:protocatechuate 3,4-dioxygenase beta subunit
MTKRAWLTNTRLVTRREAIGTLSAASAALAFGCGDSPTDPSPATTTNTTSTNAACAVTPAETAGPFPSLTDLFRSDIREGRSGTLLSLTVRVVNANASCAAVSGANVEIWHCDVAGNYSEYGASSGQTFLRGIQTTNNSGEVTFTTIYPGWYQGRATHIHLEVTVGGVSRKVTQIAFPEGVNNIVHSAGVYASRGINPVSNASDGIFADSLSSELTTPAGDIAGGYSATFQCTISL